MVRISAADMRIVKEALGSGSGYVADFTNATFNSFFKREVGASIYKDTFATHGGSKGKRLRAYLEEADDVTALRALRAIREYVVQTGWKAEWRSPEDWAPIWNAFEGLIERLENPAKIELGEEEVLPWLAKVQKKLRDIQRVAFEAYDAAMDSDKRAIAEGVKIALETHFAILKELLPPDFPASMMGDMARHIHFCDFTDMRGIVGYDVPDVMVKVERYQLRHHGHPPVRLPTTSVGQAMANTLL